MLPCIPKALTPDEPAQIRNLVLNADWADSRITAGSQSGAARGGLPEAVYPPLFNRCGSSIRCSAQRLERAM